MSIELTTWLAERIAALAAQRRAGDLGTNEAARLTRALITEHYILSEEESHATNDNAEGR